MSSAAKVWLTNDKGVRVETLTAGRLPEALRMMRESFYTDEPAAKGIQLYTFPTAVDELEQLTLDTFRDGSSLIALRNDQLLGVLFNKVQTKTPPGQGFFELFKEKCKTDVAREYVDSMIRIDAEKDVFDHYEVDCCLEVMLLGISRSARRQGIGKLLVRAAVEVARSRNVPVVSAIFSSNGSQRIGRSLQWDELHTVQMANEIFQGIPYSVFTGDDKTQVLMAYRIQ